MKKAIRILKVLYIIIQLVLILSSVLLLMLVFQLIKKSKKLIKIILITILISAIFGVIYTFIFGSSIENIVRNNINKQLKVPLSESTEIKFSLFKNFPNASVTLSNVQINDAYEKSSDTLIYAQKAIIKFNIIDILLKDYSFKNISVSQGSLNIKYDENGYHNFDIFKESSDSNTLNIKNIKILDLNLSYYNKQDSTLFNSRINNINLYFNSLYPEKSFSIDGKLSKVDLNVKKSRYLLQNTIDIDAQVMISSNSIKIKSPEIIINNVNFKKLEYLYSNNEYLLDFLLKDENIEDITSIIPEKFQYLLEDYKLTGVLNSNVKIEKKKENVNASCDINFKLINANYKSLTTPFELSEINSDGTFTNGKSQNLKTCKLIFKNLQSKKKTGVFNGDFAVTDFNKYYLVTNFYSKWELKELNELFLEDDSPFKNLKGSLEGDVNYSGRLSFNKKMKEHISSSIHSANWNFKNVSFNYKESDLDFIFKNSNWEIKDHIVKIEKDNFQISESDLTFSGKIEYLILYLLDQKKKINVNGRASSKNSKFEELLTVMDINEDSEDYTSKFSGVFPDWISVDVEFYIEQFSYRNFKSTKFNGEIEYLPNPNSNFLGRLSGKNMNMSVLDGNIESHYFEYTEDRNNDLQLNAPIKLNKIDVEDVFTSFNNFGQSFITQENIKGIANVDITTLKAFWDGETDTLYSKDLYVEAKIEINNGEIINFEPMESLHKFLKIDDLKNIKFATLENEIRIRNKKIKIPKMDIHSSAVSISLSGKHFFDNKMKYKIGLSLSDILSKEIKNDTSNINLQNLESDHKGKTIIWLNMYGYPGDIKISLDKLKLKDDIGKEVKKEIEKIKDIVEKDVLDNSPQEQDENESEYEIEHPEIDLENPNYYEFL